MSTLAMNNSASAPQGAIDADKLDALLAQLEDEHSVLLGLAHEHKQALTHADVKSLQRITMRTSETLMRIARIEQERQSMIAKRGEPVDTLDELLKRFGEDDRTKLNERRARLRELIGRVRDEQRAVKQASEQLAMHMKGLMKQVSASLSHAGTYSRGGSIESGRSQVVSGLDTVS
jgi:hypothetical protein